MQNKIPARNDSDPRFHWHIEDYYANDGLWESTFTALEQEIPCISAFSGRLAESGAALLACLEKNLELSLTLDQLYTYANMRLHEDSANAFYQAMAARAERLLVQYSAASSFLTPEITAIPEETLASFRAENPDGFAVYAHYFHSILRQKAHTLSPSEENLLAQAAELGGAPQQIFAMLNDADIRFPAVQDSKGEEMELTDRKSVV